MKLLKIYNRDKSLIKNLKTFSYTSLTENKINQLKIYENPKIYENKIVEVWDFNKPLVSGIVKKYTWDNNKKEGTIYIYPLVIDLQRDFIKDSVGNKIYYISDSIEGVLNEILDQYLNSGVIINKVLSKGNFVATGRNVRFTFNYASLYDAFLFLQKKMLKKGFYIKIDITGKVDLVKMENSTDLKNLVDIFNINFTERIDENIKTIIFDNKNSKNHILKEYTNPNPAVQEGKVKYLADARFKDVESVDNYVEVYFEEHGSPKVDTKQIITDIDIPLYSKINIYNWEKNFLDIYVVGKTFLPARSKGEKQKFNLKLGSDDEFKVDNEEDLAKVSAEVSTAIENNKVPEYIKETYIDSTEIRSPTIKGNNGLFSGVIKVGTNGIIIDGADKSIRSKNYNLANKVGFKFKDDGTFLLGQNSNNYLQFDGTNFKFAGNLKAGSGSVIDWGYIDNAPTDDWENPSYIKSTKITSTTIESPNIASNYGKISGVLKVGTNGIIIDGVNKYIKSSNFSSGSAGWRIKNDGSAEFQDGTFRGTIKATGGSFSGNLTSSATIEGGDFIGGAYYTTRNNNDNTTYAETIRLKYGMASFMYDGDEGGYIKLNESLGSIFYIMKKNTSLVDRVRIGIEGEPYLEIDSLDGFKFKGDDVDFDYQSLNNIDNVNCHDLYTTNIRSNFTYLRTNLFWRSGGISIPNGNSSADSATEDKESGSIYFEKDTNKLWIYNGSSWKYVILM